VTVEDTIARGFRAFNDRTAPTATPLCVSRNAKPEQQLARNLAIARVGV